MCKTVKTDNLKEACTVNNMRFRNIGCYVLRTLFEPKRMFGVRVWKHRDLVLTGLANTAEQFTQLMNWCRPSWLTCTMCLVWQWTWKNHLDKKNVLLNRFIFLFSNQDHKGRIERDLSLIGTTLIFQKTENFSMLSFEVVLFYLLRRKMLY